MAMLPEYSCQICGQKIPKASGICEECEYRERMPGNPNKFLFPETYEHWRIPFEVLNRLTGKDEK